MFGLVHIRRVGGREFQVLGAATLKLPAQNEMLILCYIQVCHSGVVCMCDASVVTLLCLCFMSCDTV